MDVKDLQSTINGIIISYSSVVSFSLRRSKRYQWIKSHLNGTLRKKLKLYSNKIFYGSKEISHVVVKTDEEGMTERTLKYLYGVASGVWVLSITWIIDSLNSNTILPEVFFSFKLLFWAIIIYIKFTKQHLFQ